MNKLAPLLIVVLAAICVGEGIALWRMDRRLARIEAAPPIEAASRSRSESAARATAVEAAARAEEGVRELTERITVLEHHRDRVLSSLPALEAGDRGAVDGAIAEGGAVSGALERRLEEVVDRKVAEQLKERDEEGGAFGDEDKPSIAELSEAVEMTDAQEDAAVRVFDDGKRQTFELLGLRRADGTSLLDDLVTGMKDAENPRAAMEKWFQRMFTEKVPGRSETYIAEIIKIQRTVWDGLGTALDEKQVKKLRRLGLDVLEVKTGYDPFAELLEGR